MHKIFSGYAEVNVYKFELYYEEEAITKFRELCQLNVMFLVAKISVDFIL
ncbi:MAG: hypothetical protein RSC93_10230 [Erysipelotrichaceae bacterium]